MQSSPADVYAGRMTRVTVDRRIRKHLTRGSLLRLRHEIVRKHGAFEIACADRETMCKVFGEFAPYFRHVPRAEEKALRTGFDISGMKFTPAYA